MLIISSFDHAFSPHLFDPNDQKQQGFSAILIPSAESVNFFLLVSELVLLFSYKVKYSPGKNCPSLPILPIPCNWKRNINTVNVKCRRVKTAFPTISRGMIVVCCIPIQTVLRWNFCMVEATRIINTLYDRHLSMRKVLCPSG